MNGERGLAIQVVNPLAAPDWDDLAGGHADSTFFHGPPGRACS